MTYGSFAVLDRKRDLPTVAGRRKRDFSIWNFVPHGREVLHNLSILSPCRFLISRNQSILTETSSPVIGPALMPPGAALIKEVMEQQKLRALYPPPSIAEQVLHEPNRLEQRASTRVLS